MLIEVLQNEFLVKLKEVMTNEVLGRNPSRSFPFTNNKPITDFTELSEEIFLGECKNLGIEPTVADLMSLTVACTFMFYDYIPPSDVTGMEQADNSIYHLKDCVEIGEVVPYAYYNEVMCRSESIVRRVLTRTDPIIGDLVLNSVRDAIDLHIFLVVNLEEEMRNLQEELLSYNKTVSLGTLLGVLSARQNRPKYTKYAEELHSRKTEDSLNVLN